MKTTVLCLALVPCLAIAQQRSVFDQWDQNKERARSASPITYVTEDDAAFLHVHGTADQLVPFAQSVDFNKRLAAAGVTTTLVTVKDGGHGSFGKAGAQVQTSVGAFLSHHLLGEQEAAVKDQTLHAR